MKNDKGYVPVYEFAKDNNLTQQTIYRWIREGKLKEGDFILEEKIVRRLRIRKDLEIKKQKGEIVK